MAGKPLIEHTIIAAERTSFIQNTISTDSKYIKDEYKSRVEMLTDPVNMPDSSTAVSVVKHFIRTTKKFFLKIIS